MNRESPLRKTRSYDAWLTERLAVPHQAAAYLDAAVELYHEDNDANALLLALLSVALATVRAQENSELPAGTAPAQA